MSSLKLKHSGGNSVSLNPPTSAPTSSDVAFKLPNADGSADQVLKTDGSGNFGFVANGVSSAQQFRLAADQSGSGSHGTVLTNWEESDTDYQAIGSNWSQSSGVFSCSTTGIYICSYSLVVSTTSEEDAYDPNIQISTDSASNFTTRSRIWGKVNSGSSVQNDSPTALFMFDVANSGTFRLRYRQSQDNALGTSTTVAGSSTETLTNIMFIRLGDT